MYSTKTGFIMSLVVGGIVGFLGAVYNLPILTVALIGGGAGAAIGLGSTKEAA